MTPSTDTFATAQLEQFFEAAPDAMIGVGADGRIVLVNSQTEQLFGHTREELIGATVETLVPDRLRATHVRHRERYEADAVTRPMGTGLELAGRRKDGSEFPAEISLSSIMVHGGRLATAAIRDVTERRRAEAARRAAEERFRVAFEEAAVATAIVALEGDDRGRIVHANPRYAELLGRSLDEITGQKTSAWIHPDDHERAYALPLARLATGDVTRLQFERRYLHRDGHVVWTLVSDAAIRDENGHLIAIGQVLDISERKEFEGQLKHLADHDALTGLVNRRRFEIELDRMLAHARRYGGRGAVLALDLDGFKFVNDSLGHAVGDELVIRLAGALARSLRETDIVARTGGDEFAVILPEASEIDACRVAEKLLCRIRRNGTILNGSGRAHVTTSIGVTTFGPRDQLTGQDLLIEADIAMYDAKAAGKDCHAVYRRDVGRRERIAARQEWLTRLRTAIDEQRFVLHAQPVVPVCSNGVPRFELLLRMPDEHGDLIAPGTFLYNAERFGLIEQIDHWVMTEAVRLLEVNHAAGQQVALSVNMSAKTLNAGGVAPLLAELLERHPIPPGLLVVELTETAAISNMELAQDLARDLRALGVRVALDDFGAGFATFYYLKHLEFDYVKIDGEFIRHLPANKTDQLVVRSVVEVVRGLGADTIAEFVQDDATLTLLRQLGVGYAQGYHTGRPGAIEHMLPLVAKSQGSPAATVKTT